MTTQQNFNDCCSIEYLCSNWLNETELWLAVFRQDRTIFEVCKTNMLHHLLKGKFMEGKRNRCLNHLIYVLIEKAIPYFRARHHRQLLGFEGPDLEI
ncbi:hypothetical protein K443DRAFT_134155 [Laccaria amethystina LaAM-08-1]|uniref:Uncharacterized protein n=1 Tax=Laccaria amethystina LaAM-08-1 TaxID=1095629 RepID=A0A0C9XJP7_9AGAR|nr:hypothetical protein K443DRAFT_134155 [Laccaria amethystina LaAM-08-1]